MTFWVEQAVISTFVHQFNEFAIHELIQFLYSIFEANVWFCMSFFFHNFCLFAQPVRWYCLIMFHFVPFWERERQLRFVFFTSWFLFFNYVPRYLIQYYCGVAFIISFSLFICVELCEWMIFELRDFERNIFHLKPPTMNWIIYTYKK